MYRLLRSEELCEGREHGASQCPRVTHVKCAACGFEWLPESNDPNDPGACPNCDQFSSTPKRCDQCPVNEVGYYRSTTPTGRLLDRVLEHDFDCKHYRVDAGETCAETREGLKVLEAERTRWERETREEQQRKFEEKQRVLEMQRRSGQHGF